MAQSMTGGASCNWVPTWSLAPRATSILLITAGGALGPVLVQAAATTASAAIRARRSMPFSVAEVVVTEADEETAYAVPRRGSGHGPGESPRVLPPGPNSKVLRYCWGVVSAGRCGVGLSGANRDS